MLRSKGTQDWRHLHEIRSSADNAYHRAKINRPEFRVQD
jgi:hypothetical protein